MHICIAALLDDTDSASVSTRSAQETWKIMLRSMEDGPLWPACDAQVALHHQVGMFSVPESHDNLLGVPESPLLPSWQNDAYEMADIALMSSTSDTVSFDHVLNTLPAVSTDVNDLVCGNPKFRQMDQWGHFYQSTDMTDILAATHHHPYLPAYNSPDPSHLQQECASIYNTNLECASVYKQPLCTTPVQHNRGIASTESVALPQYGGPSLGIFEATVPLVSNNNSTINNTPLGSCTAKLGAHLLVPKQHQSNTLGHNTRISVSIPEGRSGGSLSSGQGVGTTVFTPKQVSNSVSMHKPDVPSEDPKMRMFNPGPYKPTQKQQHEHQEVLSAIWGKSVGSCSSTLNSSIPKLSNVNNGFDKHPLPIIPSRSIDTRESTADWTAVRKVVVGGGGCIAVTGNEKGTSLMQQHPESDAPKCALPPRSQITPMVNGNVMHKRPHLWVDDNRDQMFPQNKKPMPGKCQEGCSRLEVISAAAHQKVQNNTSGRALGPALNTNLKPRARQGSANDPQSIAARVRRERISERLKLLQTLIPNGDKVDMVTMLDKAIIYVQCLDLQIRMLKNDSLWPKALITNSLEELRNLAGPEFVGGTRAEDTLKNMTTEVATDTMKHYEASQPPVNRE